MRTSAWRRLLGAVLLSTPLALLALLVSMAGSTSQTRVVTTLLINTTIVVGLQIFIGNSGIVSLGHVAFIAIGAYGVAIMATPVVFKSITIPDAPFGLADLNLPVILAAAVAIVVVGVVALISGLAIVRQSGLAAAIATLALFVVVRDVILNWSDLTRGPQVFYGVPISAKVGTALIVAIVVIAVARLFRDSQLGLQLRASRDDEGAALSAGIDVRRLRLFAWVLSAAVVGCGGVLTTLSLGTVSVRDFSFHAIFVTITMLLVGGVESVSGAVVGAIAIAAGFELARALETGPTIMGIDLPVVNGLPDFFLGAALLSAMILRPSGLVGGDEIDDSFARWRRRRAASREVGDGEQTEGASEPLLARVDDWADFG